MLQKPLMAAPGGPVTRDLCSFAHTPISSLPLTCWALPAGGLETSLLAVEVMWAGLAHEEGTVCSGRLEKVPVGHRMGLCDAEAEDTGRPQVWGVGSSWAAGLDPASEMDGAIMALPIGPTSAQPPRPTPSNMQQVKRPQTSPLCNWRNSSGLITPNYEPPVRQGHCHPLSAVYTKQLTPQQAPSAFCPGPNAAPLSFGTYRTSFPSGFLPVTPGPGLFLDQDGGARQAEGGA